MSMESPTPERPRWLDDFENVKRIYRGLWGVCLLLLVVGEGLLRWARGHAAEGHGEQHGFAFESFSGFYAFFGLVACVALVLAAKELRKLIMRPEDYYGD